MTERARIDVAIIGGGTAGCAAALAMRKRGLAVTLFEKGVCGGQASGVNFGGVRQQGRHLAELPLARRSRQIWDRLPDLIGIDGEFEASGHLKLARSEADLATLEAYARDAAEYGLELRMIGRNAIRVEYPWLGDVVLGGSLCAEDGQANPRIVAPAFARAARAAGAVVREHTRIVGASWTGTQFEIEAQDGSRTSATYLVNTAGLWANEVAGWFGETTPMYRISPNMLVTEPVPYVIDRSLGVCGAGAYVRQTRRGNVVFGGGEGWGDPDIERSRPRTEASLTAMQYAVSLVPALRHAMIIRSWTGLEGEMPDVIPVIGPSATTPHLFHAFGFSGHGFQLGPVIGEILDELVAEGRTPTPIDAFSITRFTAPSRGATQEAM